MTYCEICGNLAKVKYHIENENMNLDLCNSCHIMAHKGEFSKDFLMFAHKVTMQGIVFEADRHKNRTT